MIELPEHTFSVLREAHHLAKEAHQVTDDGLHLVEEGLHLTDEELHLVEGERHLTDEGLLMPEDWHLPETTWQILPLMLIEIVSDFLTTEKASRFYCYY